MVVIGQIQGIPLHVAIEPLLHNQISDILKQLVIVRGLPLITDDADFHIRCSSLINFHLLYHTDIQVSSVRIPSAFFIHKRKNGVLIAKKTDIFHSGRNHLVPLCIQILIRDSSQLTNANAVCRDKPQMLGVSRPTKCKRLLQMNV